MGKPNQEFDRQLDLASLRALLIDAAKDTVLWLALRPSAEESLYVRGMQAQMAELHPIVDHRIEARATPDEEQKWSQTVTAFLSFLEKARGARGNIVGTKLARLADRLADELSGSQPPHVSKALAPATPVSKPTDRRAMVKAYIEEVRSKTGKRITKRDIWSRAGYQTRTEFERWERQDSKHPNRSADENFSRILRQKPHLK